MPHANQTGFTYVMVLVAVVVLGILAEAATEMTSRVVQADREAELLFRGQAYRDAIKSYYESGRGAKTYPRTLEDLTKDPRTASSKRHIRALYPDPMAKGEKKDWTLIRAPDGGIGGVASSSKAEPLKKANFPKEFEKFAGTKSYSEWIFEFKPPSVVPGGSPIQPVPSSGTSQMRDSNLESV